MKTNNILKRLGFMLGVAVAGVTVFTSCNPEPDESDLFTATGETATDFILRKSELTSFTYILRRVGLDRNLASYGEYTCYAPVNSAITEYIDSLYNDEKAVIPHNSMEDHGALAAGQHAELNWLSDSLCNDIARYHLSSGIHTTIEMGGSVTLSTMLGRSISASGATGVVVLNKVATIVQADSTVTNGVVHIIDKVIPNSTRTLSDELERMPDFKIFMEALKLTGLTDSLKKSKKDVEYTITDYNDNNSTKDPLYHPTECKIAYTIFAEPDEVFQKAGINNINDLIEKCKEWYGNATWYTYFSEKGKPISQGTDYTERNNVLNMFVAYHLLYAGMPVDQLVFEDNANRWPNEWNYVNGGEPFDYYETMLPGTLMKIWQPQPGKALYINRWISRNTLTDEVGTKGSAAIHELKDPGVRINRATDTDNTNIQAYNGYIHSLRGILLYHENVPKGVLNERMRFEATTFLPEFINNGIRMSTNGEMKDLNGGGSGARVAFPLNYFDNVKSYTSENRLRYNIKGVYNAWQADAFQGWGNYDLAIKMPPLPTGTYEFRLYYAPMSHGGMMQFYMGKSSNLSDMIALDIPLDVRIDKEDPRIGWTDFMEEDDNGIATDAAMRNRGYMRGPYSFKDHMDLEKAGEEMNMRRGTRNAGLRKILGVLNVKQSEEQWFRIKNVIPDETDLKWQLDFVEFVSFSVVNSSDLAEDWF